MLRDGDHYAAAPTYRSMHLVKHGFVFGYVFDDIKSPDHIELIFKRDVPRIHLEQLGSLHSSTRQLQSLGEYLTATGLDPGEDPLDLGQHVSRAAADLQETSHGREMLVQRGPYEGTTCFEPKILRFQLYEFRKEPFLESIID